MGDGRKRNFVRGMALLLSISMLLGTAGCAGGGTESSSESESVTQESSSSADLTESSSAEESSTSEGQDDIVKEVVREKITDNGKAIWDFDEFVNKATHEEQAREGETDLDYRVEMSKLMKDRIIGILSETDLSTLSEDDGLYKAATLYRQLMDPSNQKDRVKSIKTMVKELEKVKTLDDLYKAYLDPKYKPFNTIMCFDSDPDDDGYNGPIYAPTIIGVPPAKISECLVLLGYSEKKAKEMVDNATTIDSIVYYFRQELNKDGEYNSISQRQLESHEIAFPVFDFLDTDAKDGYFFADFRCYDFWKMLFQKDNVGRLRDYLACCVAARTSFLLGADFWKDYVSEEEYKYTLENFVMRGCSDVVMEEYKKRYLVAAIPKIDAMIEEIKAEERNVIAKSEWLDTHGKETARGKVIRMTQNIASNDVNYDLADVTLTGNVVDDVVATWAGQLRFQHDQIGSYEPGLFNIAMDEVNAYYYGSLNRIVMPSGWISSPYCAEDAKYEERLAYLGTTIAHEITHSFDPDRGVFDYEKYYDPLKSGKDAYWERITLIENFFDGMEVQYGQKLEGSRVRGETFADLIAMQVCLNMLKERENPDYDLFFRTYAITEETTYTEEGMKDAVLDNHLPSKERINYVLGQFEEFYETYEIDENSPYYVPVEKRLPVL